MSSKYNISAIVLAAGLSSRMQGEHKLTKNWQGSPLINHCLNTLETLNLNQITLVLGNNADEIKSLITPQNYTIIENPSPKQGLSQSIKLGLTTLPENTDATFITLSDMPLIQPEDYQSLISAFSPDKSICVPTYNNQTGNPVLFGKQWFDEIADLTGDKGAKSIIKANKKHVNFVPVKTNGILQDFDTTEDFQNTNTYALWRQDDNGNRFCIETALTEEDARRKAKHFEDLGHKQMFWVEKDT